MNTSALVEELKSCLKKRRITYKSLALRLKLSEAAVKRLFSERNFSLRRLDEICVACGIELEEVFIAAKQQSARPEALAADVEIELAADDDLLFALYLILLKTPTKKIVRELGTDELGLFRICRRLEKLGLVAVHPHKRVVPLISKSVRWSPDGALAKKYGGAILSEFFNCRFDAEDEHQDFLTGGLSSESIKVLKRKINELFREFEQLSDLDQFMPDEDRTVFWFYTGIRPWAPLPVIGRHRGNPTSKGHSK